MLDPNETEISLGVNSSTHAPVGDTNWVWRNKATDGDHEYWKPDAEQSSEEYDFEKHNEYVKKTF